MRDPNSTSYKIESWLLWMMATGVGWPMGVTTAQAIATYLAEVPKLMGLLIGGLVAGGLVAVAGWFAVRQKIRSPGHWLVTAAVAWPVSLLLAELIFQVWATLPGWFLAHILGGALYGGLQSRSFHADDPDRGRWWLVAMTAWLITGALELWLPSDGGITARAAQDEAVLGVIGWPLLTVMAFFINLLILPKPRGKKDEEGLPMWPKAEEDDSDPALPPKTRADSL